MSLLNAIQQKLKAPKGQLNKFGNYRYRNAEDILEAVKPLLGEGTLIITDEIMQIGDRFYVKATVALTSEKDGDKQTWMASAFARESFDKKGMDAAQITGATSSYARKYALNGLFCIDDTKDADSDEKLITGGGAGQLETTWKVPRKVPASDDEAGGNTESKQFLEQDEINAVNKEAIKDLLATMGKKQTKSVIKELTELDMIPENYQAIRAKLQTLLEKTDPLEQVTIT